MRGTNILAFLRDLLRYMRDHVLVVRDNLGTHKVAAVLEFRARQTRLHLEYPPPYAPDPNPEEEYGVMQSVTWQTARPTIGITAGRRGRGSGIHSRFTAALARLHRGDGTGHSFATSSAFFAQRSSFVAVPYTANLLNVIHGDCGQRTTAGWRPRDTGMTLRD